MIDIKNLGYCGMKLLGCYLLGFEVHLKILIQILNVLDYAASYIFS